jgi:hypothetical protein
VGAFDGGVALHSDPALAEARGKEAQRIMQGSEERERRAALIITTLVKFCTAVELSGESCPLCRETAAHDLGVNAAAAAEAATEVPGQFDANGHAREAPFGSMVYSGVKIE